MRGQDVGGHVAPLGVRVGKQRVDKLVVRLLGEAPGLTGRVQAKHPLGDIQTLGEASRRKGKFVVGRKGQGGADEKQPLGDIDMTFEASPPKGIVAVGRDINIRFEEEQILGEFQVSMSAGKSKGQVVSARQVETGME